MPAALARVGAADGPARVNVTDPDATLQQARGGGFLVGDNAQAMVAGRLPQHPDEPAAPGGLLLTAADVTPDRDDHGQLLPLVEPAATTTEPPVAQVLAAGGYHAAANLVACAAQAPPVLVLMPDPQAPRPSQPYHKDRFTDAPATDTCTGPQGQTLTCHGRVSRGPGRPTGPPSRAAQAVCDAWPVRAQCTPSTTKGRSIAISPHDAARRTHRARMATDVATTASRRRTTLPEPVFGSRKERQGARRFLLRGLANVQAEWTLLAVACNLRTLARIWRTTDRLPLPTAA